MKRILKFYYIYYLFFLTVLLFFLHIKGFYIHIANAQVGYNNFGMLPPFGSFFQYPHSAPYPQNPWNPFFFPSVTGNRFFFNPSAPYPYPIERQSLMPNPATFFSVPSFFNSYESFFPNRFNNVLTPNSFTPFYQSFQPSPLPYTMPWAPIIPQNLTIFQNISPFPRPEKPSEYPIPEEIPQERVKTLKKALDWIFDNTTDLRNTSALEIGEEIILFYQLYRRAQSQEAKDFCKRFINFRIKQIIDSGKLINPTGGEITVFLSMCEIMLKLGPSLFDYRSFINNKVLSNSEIFNPGYDIWNASSLERLGFYPPVPLASLIPNGSIVTEFQTGNLIRLMDSPGTDIFPIWSQCSDIIHEIFPLTNFGETPIMMITPDQITFLKHLIAKGILFFIQTNDLDMISELLICANMIDLNDQSLLDVAYQYIIDNQTADGSFGDILRFTQMGRSNASRHTVYVAVWAMIL
jgi:hypothetical protein